MDRNIKSEDVVEISVALDYLRDRAGYLCALVDQGHEIDDRTAKGIADVIRWQAEKIERAVWGPDGEPRGIDPNSYLVKMFRKIGIELCKEEVAK